MLKYRCNPADPEAMALLQEISGAPSPPDKMITKPDYIYERHVIITTYV
jgi:hypothetical protein